MTTFPGHRPLNHMATDLGLHLHFLLPIWHLGPRLPLHRSNIDPTREAPLEVHNSTLALPLLHLHPPLIEAPTDLPNLHIIMDIILPEQYLHARLHPGVQDLLLRPCVLQWMM